MILKIISNGRNASTCSYSPFPRISSNTSIRIIDNKNSIQIDCDSTISTKEKYFNLLVFLSDYIDCVSATIRLHQINYFRVTGVQTVNRGVLMI